MTSQGTRRAYLKSVLERTQTLPSSIYAISSSGCTVISSPAIQTEEHEGKQYKPCESSLTVKSWSDMYLQKKQMKCTTNKHMLPIFTLQVTKSTSYNLVIMECIN